METDQTIAGLGHALHLERRISAARCHREAHRGRPDDAARELRTLQPGRADRRAQPRSIPASRPTTTMAYDAATGGYTQPRLGGRSPDQSRARPRHPHAADRRVLGRRSIGELPAATRRAAAYIRKSGANFIAWTDTGGQYREETRTLQRLFRAGVRAHERASDRRFLLTNPADFSMDLPRPGGRDGKAHVERVAGVRLLHVLARTGLQAASGTTADGAAAQHRGARDTCSAAIPTTSPTRTGGCRTIARTSSG